MVDERDIQQLNRLYFMIAQNAARQNVAFAEQMTGISKPNLEKIASLSLSEIDWIHSEMKFLLFKPRVSDQALTRLLELPNGSRGAFVSSTLNKKGMV